MNDKEREKLLKAIRTVTRRDTKSVEAATKAFVQSGIYERNGQLSENYGGVRNRRRRDHHRPAPLSA